MTPAFPTSGGDVLRLMTILGSGYVVLSSAEYLAARDRLRDDDILSWKVSSRRRIFAKPVVSSIAEATMPYRRFLVVLLARLILGVVAGVFALRGELVPVVFAGIVATTFAISFRNPYGLDGGFQMSFLTFSGVLIASVFPAGSVGRTLAILFVAAQAVLSYLIAGLAKLNSEVWREGTALTGIFGTSIYGHEVLYEKLRTHPKFDAIGCWATIAFECLFPLVVITPPEYVPVFLVLGLGFHAGTAVFMGLNGFLLPFVATYPAIVYANLFVRGLL